MRQVGPDHMQSEDLTQPQQDLCSITMPGRGMEGGFLSRSATEVDDRGGLTAKANSGNAQIHDTEKWKESACVCSRAWRSVSQATPRNGLPPASYENPTVCNIIAGFNWSGRAELVGLGLDLSGRDHPDDRMPASTMRRYHSRRSSPTSGTMTD